jgi:hypothetical protein
VEAQSFLDGFCSQTASQRRAFEPERWTNQQLDRAGSRDFPARIHPGIENCVTPRTAHEDAPLVSAEDKALKKAAQNFGEFEAKGYSHSNAESALVSRRLSRRRLVHL